ncbi:MAG: SDR family NAD(P)-dependent oxidoreductase [Sulfolobales archaeon]|jgi:NAD(P)-dependent dehydrogenase (short-subunit alcohol dehydrogenase family)
MDNTYCRRFEGKVVLIVGGAGGMGSVTAKEFAREGAEVVIADVDVSRMEMVAEEIRSSGGRCTTIKCDVTVASEVKNTVDTVLSKFGKIDILVYFTGILGEVAPIWESSEENWDKVMNVNLKGAFLFCREVAKHMIKRREGKIITISSVAGKDPNPYMLAYDASKAGLIGFTRGLALELAPYNVNVNCVVPGITETPFLNFMTEEAKKRSASLVPLGRLGKPEEIAKVVLFLASDDASFVTGAAWNVTGGRCPY